MFLEYSNFFKWFRFSKNYADFYSINFIFQTICDFLTPRFTLICEKISKRLKKKLKKKYRFKIKYVPLHTDFKKALKWVYLYSMLFDKVKLSIRLFYSIFTTFFEEKKSFLYLKKIKIYKKVLKKNRIESHYPHL